MFCIVYFYAFVSVLGQSQTVNSRVDAVKTLIKDSSIGNKMTWKQSPKWAASTTSVVAANRTQEEFQTESRKRVGTVGNQVELETFQFPNVPRRLAPLPLFPKSVSLPPFQRPRDHYYLPIKYYDSAVQLYRTLHVKVTENDEVKGVAQQAARLTRGLIPPQQAVLYLNDENMAQSKRLLRYYYNNVQNGGTLELDYNWKNVKPRNPYMSMP